MKQQEQIGNTANLIQHSSSNIEDSPSLHFTNSELSWLEFNERVLEEAQDKSNPLMERLKFLAITASNLDEFFMVRVSGIVSRILGAMGNEPDETGLTPRELLSAISRRVNDMVTKQYNCLVRSLLPALERHGIRFYSYAALDETQRSHVDQYFSDVLYQILTPMAIDQSRPFPTINNRTINVFIELAADKDAPLVRTVNWNKDENRWSIGESHATSPKYALVQVPTVVSRIVELPCEDGFACILLENIILAHISKLFLGHRVVRTALLRVTRSSDLHIDEEYVEDLLDEMVRSVKHRRTADPVRVEISKGFSKKAIKLLERELGLSDEKIFEVTGPMDLTTWMGFAMREEFSRMRHRPIPPTPCPQFYGKESMFDVIRERDVLVHHPYLCFESVERFVREAAADPNVLAIKQTLYRVSSKSPIVRALIAAAENGKQVTVLMELRARFDEENNINQAILLEKSGVHVIYGLMGLKIHCKMCLVVRREPDAIRRYVHLGTGNYNEATAKIYTDMGLFTCRETFGQDASVLFNVLTGFSTTTSWQKFAVSPLTLRPALMRLVEKERENARAGKPAGITARMNSLSDFDMIRELYAASGDGVKIRLLVRGICVLRPGIPGVSENITVSSIIDRYLEHTRAYVFENAGHPLVFLASADLMTRNLDRRVEIMFPIEDAALCEEIISLIELSLSDNTKLRRANKDGTYAHVSRRGRPSVHSQLEMHRRVSCAFEAVSGEKHNLGSGRRHYRGE